MTLRKAIVRGVIKTVEHDLIKAALAAADHPDHSHARYELKRAADLYRNTLAKIDEADL